MAGGPAAQVLAPASGIGYLQRTMIRSRRPGRLRYAVLCVGVIAGCSASLGRPTATPTGDQAPVTLRNLQIETVDGHRAVLLRLSRIPTLVRHSSSSDPARITIQAWGPPGDQDLEERNLAQIDPQITQVRVSRRAGALNVVFDLQGNHPPQYTVHEMADWIMIRFPTSGT
jgi:hypothetical protein